MSSLNKAILIGNLGKDPEVRYSKDGAPIASFSIATSETWKDKVTGEKKEKTEWHNISVFGRLAEIVGQYLKKGSTVYVEGRITTEKWTDKEGNDRYTTKIIANEMKMLGGKGYDGRTTTANEARHDAVNHAEVANGGGAFNDDVPF